MRSYLVLGLGAVLLAFPACSTEQISTPVTYDGGGPGPDRGELTIVFAPSADTKKEAQAQGEHRGRLSTAFSSTVASWCSGACMSASRYQSVTGEAVACTAAATSPPARTISRSRGRAAVL